jgi:hypothetical protein
MLCVLAVGAVVWGATARRTEFPGQEPELMSPDRQYVLRNVDSDTEPHHVLYLRDQARGSEEQLFAYDRHVSALWSPDGKALLINDHGASDSSNCFIFLVDDVRQRIDVRERLAEQLGANKSINSNHHVYVEGISWLGPDVAKIQVSGYGDVDPKGFKLSYRYQLGGRFLAMKGGK